MPRTEARSGTNSSRSKIGQTRNIINIKNKISALYFHRHFLCRHTQFAEVSGNTVEKHISNEAKLWLAKKYYDPSRKKVDKESKIKIPWSFWCDGGEKLKENAKISALLCNQYSAHSYMLGFLILLLSLPEKAPTRTHNDDGDEKKLLQLFFPLNKLEQSSSAHTHKSFKDVLPSFLHGKSEVNWIKTGIRWKTLLVWRPKNFMKKSYQTPRNNSTIREQLTLNFRIRIMFVVCSSPPARLSFSYNSIFHPYSVIFCLIFFFFIIVRLYKNFIVRIHTHKAAPFAENSRTFFYVYGFEELSTEWGGREEKTWKWKRPCGSLDSETLSMKINSVIRWRSICLNYKNQRVRAKGTWILEWHENHVMDSRLGTRKMCYGKYL